MSKILGIDVGTTETAICLIDVDYKPIMFGKYTNDEVLETLEILEKDTQVVIEEFASYGMPIGQTTMQAIKWNGRIQQRCYDLGIDNVGFMFRKDVKMNLCGSMKAKDSNIRQALIDRFGEVGVKSNQGWFYGFKADIWSAYAIATTYLDRKGELWKPENTIG